MSDIEYTQSGADKGPHVPPHSYDDIMARWRCASDLRGNVTLQCVRDAAESDYNRRYPELFANQPMLWLRSARQAEREGILDSHVAEAFVWVIALAFVDEMKDDETERLFERMREIHDASGLSPDEFWEGAARPVEAVAIDARLDTRRIERLAALLRDAGEHALARDAEADWERIDRRSAEVLASVCDRVEPTARRSGWFLQGDPVPGAPHSAFRVALGRPGAQSERDRRGVDAAMSAIEIAEYVADYGREPEDAPLFGRLRGAIDAMDADDPMRAAVLRVANYLQMGYSADDRLEPFDRATPALFEIAEVFESRGEDRLAADVYWTIGWHVYDHQVVDRARVRRLRIEARLLSATQA